MNMPVSKQLRQRRLELGLSLSELARRADTSVATLSRYESGWTRFELYTLGKLASALGCELHVALTPLHTPASRPLSARALRRQLQRLFWDHKLSPLDLQRHALWVVERVLEYGQLRDVLGLEMYYGRRRFLQIVSRSSRLSRRTAAFWAQMLKKEGVTCTRKYCRPAVWKY